MATNDKYLPKKRVRRRRGDEPFVGMEGNLLEFWEWAHSDIMSNTERGRLAEFIVAKAMGAASGHRVEWDLYDVKTPDEITIEVKTSAYLQTWRQTQLSNIIFDIAPKMEWVAGINQYKPQPKRHAMVYVFCLFAAQDGMTANPMALDQWEFYVLPTRVLDAHMPVQKTIGLKSLVKLGARKVSFDELKAAVHAFVE